MVSKIARFEYIVTDSELEALVLECNLIKEHRPRYNTMLKDDKTYPYIKVTASEEYPRILFSRQMKKDKNKYFGPFTSAGAVGRYTGSGRAAGSCRRIWERTVRAFITIFTSATRHVRGIFHWQIIRNR